MQRKLSAFSAGVGEVNFSTRLHASTKGNILVNDEWCNFNF